MIKNVLVVLLLLVVGYVVMDRFVLPSYTRQGESVMVPDVQKMKYDEALRTLRSSGLAGKKSYNVRYLRNIDPDMVIVQRPVAGSEVKPGRTVALVVNKQEKPTFVLPDFYGRRLDEVRQILERVDISLMDIQEQEVTDPAEDGKVLSQSIAPKTVLSHGSSLSVTVGKAEEIQAVTQIRVPDVLGMSLNQARDIIVRKGFNSGNVSYEYSALLVPYTVINQKPSVNSLADPGKVIDLTVVINEE
ncbi:MAG: PASTA domain-containing protein [Chlorobium phaeobacteroides]|uniref:PASTA domain containing protein n=1 Tax=Chlorobium phaeobacteroides (strain BS1) TaxID=331678 RepID=B3EJL0_CHLPB|nr:PASTA domain-containing protein [Chlorobium phaeobacteroides]